MTIDYENDGDFEYDKNKYKTITTRIKSIEPSEGWLEPSGSVGHINTIPEAGDVHVDEHEDRGSSIDDDSRTYLLYSTETRRKLENRHVQLIAISGVIGTALFRGDRKSFIPWRARLFITGICSLVCSNTLHYCVYSGNGLLFPCKFPLFEISNEVR